MNKSYAYRQKQQGPKQVKSENEFRAKFKTELCKKHQLGTCPYGASCAFAHGQDELQPKLQSARYKTKVCKNFNKTGCCSYGSRCQFIHTHSRSTSPSPLKEHLPIFMEFESRGVMLN